MNSSQSEVIQHGASMGIGLLGMATGDSNLYERLKEVVF